MRAVSQVMPVSVGGMNMDLPDLLYNMDSDRL